MKKQKRNWKCLMGGFILIMVIMSLLSGCSTTSPVAGNYEAVTVADMNDENLKQLFHCGYLEHLLTSIKESNTLELSEDYSYVYTKQITGGNPEREEDMGPVSLSIVFYGTYQVGKDEETVSLSYPTEATYDFDWGFISQAIASEKGTATKGDLVENSYQATGFFDTPYLNSPENTEQAIRLEQKPLYLKLNKEEKIFYYDADESMEMTSGIAKQEEKYESETACEKDKHQWNALNGKCKICGTVCEHGEWDTETGQCKTCKFHCLHDKGHLIDQSCVLCTKMLGHEAVNGVCACGYKAPFGFECEEAPSEYKKDCAKAGTVDEFFYQSHVYDDNGEILGDVEKRAFVYLPYGYSEEKQYNTLYLLHGTGEEEGYWFGQDGEITIGAYDVNYTCQVLDNLMEKGEMEPTIVITPTIYTNGEMVSEDAFVYELVNDIIPAVETQYATYADGDTSEQGLISSRTHRALAGLSAGAGRTKNALPKTLPYISWFACMSGGSGDPMEYLADIKKMTEQGYDIKFLYAAAGAGDHLVYGQSKEFFNTLISLDETGTVLNASKNVAWVEKNNNAHSYKCWLGDLYNIGKIFFK